MCRDVVLGLGKRKDLPSDLDIADGAFEGCTGLALGCCASLGERAGEFDQIVDRFCERLGLC